MRRNNKNYIIAVISFIALILMVATTYFSNYFAILICSGLAILAFATNKRLSVFVVVAYIITLTTLVFKLSMVYDFTYSIRISNSYIFLSMGISIVLAFMLLGYNIAKEKEGF